MVITGFGRLLGVLLVVGVPEGLVDHRVEVLNLCLGLFPEIVLGVGEPWLVVSIRFAPDDTAFRTVRRESTSLVIVSRLTGRDR